MSSSTKSKNFCITFIQVVAAISVVVGLFKGYCNVPCVLYSTEIFLLLYEIGKILEKNNLINRVVLF